MIRTSSRQNYLIGLIALFGLGGSCNVADKRSSLEKDSLANDTAVKNRIGGVETFETNMEEEAADYLKAAGTALTIQDGLLTAALERGNDLTIKGYAKKARERIRFRKKTLERFCNSYKVLLREDLPAEQIDSIRGLSKQAGADFERLFITRLSEALRSNIIAYQEAAHAREEKIRSFVKNELPAVRREFHLLNQLAAKMVK
jgi:hypothetical protein